MVQDAHGMGREIGRFMEQLLAGRFPWAHLRQAQKLLRLANKYGKARVDRACARALAFDLINVRRVERILVGSLDRAAERQPAQGELVLLPGRFLRPAGSFTPHVPGKEKDHGDQTLAQNRPEETEALGDPGDASGSNRLRSEDEAP
jgi:hypothetical protein